MKKSVIGNSWDEMLAEEWQKPYYQQLRSFLVEEYKKKDLYPGADVYPPAGDIYNALRFTDYNDVKVVILGQDPYHEPGQAHGMAFSVPVGMLEPPSLLNILKELEDDLGIVPSYRGGGGRPGGAQSDRRGQPAAFGDAGDGGSNSVQAQAAGFKCFGDESDETPPAAANDGSTLRGVPRAGAADDGERAPGLLDPWARQGVLLLNTVLTVRAHAAGSHKGRGWEQFTDKVIELLARRAQPMVFVLWGAQAQAKKTIIRRAEADSAINVAGSAGSDAGSSGAALTQQNAALQIQQGTAAVRRHLVIEAPHPSPLSAYRGFFGGRYFSRCNYFLTDNGMEPIDWHL